MVSLKSAWFTFHGLPQSQHTGITLIICKWFSEKYTNHYFLLGNLKRTILPKLKTIVRVVKTIQIWRGSQHEPRPEKVPKNFAYCYCCLFVLYCLEPKQNYPGTWISEGLIEQIRQYKLTESQDVEFLLCLEGSNWEMC